MFFNVAPTPFFTIPETPFLSLETPPFIPLVPKIAMAKLASSLIFLLCYSSSPVQAKF
nr:MAG TPA: hypothetical protein [Bacteriophage sp.]